MSLTCGCEEVEDWPSVLIPRQERRLQLGQGLIKRGDTTVNNLRRGTYGVRTNEERTSDVPVAKMTLSLFILYLYIISNSTSICNVQHMCPLTVASCVGVVCAWWWASSSSSLGPSSRFSDTLD